MTEAAKIRLRPRLVLLGAALPASLLGGLEALLLLLRGDRPELDLDSLDTVVHGTCLATDMSGFTRIAEGMPPNALAAFMNDYFEALSRPLIRNHVDVTEFRADAIMCAWDGSQADLKARERAVFAGLDFPF